MRLSEAIRLGPTIAPAIYGPVFTRGWTGKVCGACRAGATAMAGGFQPSSSGRYDWNEVVAFIDETWPWTQQLRNHYPFTINTAIGLALFHERKGMTADEIADYFERLEAKFDTRSQPAVNETAQPTKEAVCLK